MIEVQGLTKRFGRTVAVDDLSFTVQPGRVTGFLGPNGSGKSTTLRCMVSLDRPQAGTTHFDGRAYPQLRRPLTEVGALLDAGYIHPSRTARNHLLAFARSNGIGAARVDEVLGIVGLTPVARKKVGGFSLGMRQRVGLALAMLGDPGTILLDEPGNGLDPEGIQWVREFLQALARQGRTIFVSSHLLAEMALMAEDLVVIGRGRLIAQTSVADFVAQSTQGWVVVRGPQVQRLAPLLVAQGARVETDADGALRVYDAEPPAIGELAHANGVVLHELSPRQGSLEEAFLQATAGAQEYRTGAGIDTTEGEGAGAWSGGGSVDALPPPQVPS